MRLQLAMIAMFLPAAVHAAVYRCEVGGKPVYTDQPCSANATPMELPGIVTVPAGDNADLVKDADERADRERKTRDRQDAAWLKSHQAAKAEDARMDAAIAEHQVLKGMSGDQVRRALGRPDEIERHADSEQWIYGSGKARQTVMFEGDRVKTVSSKRKRR